MTKNIAGKIAEQLEATLVQDLGSGAFKTVHLIEKNGSQFALKISRVAGELQSRFQREITVLSGCDHPAIAKIFTSDFIDQDNRKYWYIVEEFFSNGTLAELVSKKQLPLDEIRHLGVTLADALVYLSERGFVHRDIKPANILFRSPREPVISDFGIVRMLGEQSLTQDFVAQGPGTPRYSAPEQLLNEKCSIDWRTDQFGLALVLSELLLGHHVYLENSESDVRDAIMLVASRRSLPVNNQSFLIEKGFSCLIKALSPWPVQRFRKPEEFLQAITEGG